MYKPKMNSKSKCMHCMEEIKKADLSRKYAHELKNIFITISTVVNSEIENPHQNYNPVSNNTSLVYESGECSPYIMDKKKKNSNVNSTTNVQNTNTHSSFVLSLHSQLEPKTYVEASKHDCWKHAMQVELQALEKTGTWKLVDLPPNIKPIG